MKKEEETETEEEQEMKPLKPIKKEKTTETDTVVVTELPTQQIREVIAEDGKKITLISIDEALTEILKNTREIKKALM